MKKTKETKPTEAEVLRALEQLAKLDETLGWGVGAQRERAKLEKIIGPPPKRGMGARPPLK